MNIFDKIFYKGIIIKYTRRKFFFQPCGLEAVVQYRGQNNIYSTTLRSLPVGHIPLSPSHWSPAPLARCHWSTAPRTRCDWPAGPEGPPPLGPTNREVPGTRAGRDRRAEEPSGENQNLLGPSQTHTHTPGTTSNQT